MQRLSPDYADNYHYQLKNVVLTFLTWNLAARKVAVWGALYKLTPGRQTLLVHWQPWKIIRYLKTWKEWAVYRSVIDSCRKMSSRCFRELLVLVSWSVDVCRGCFRLATIPATRHARHCAYANRILGEWISWSSPLFHQGRSDKSFNFVS